MIVIVCIGIGLALRIATGRNLGGLADTRMRGEGFLIALLLSQALLPLLQLNGAAARVAYYAWLATFPCMVAIAWLNRREPGMPSLGIGLLLNFAVVASNGGMPVFASAVEAVRGPAQALAIPAGDFIHVAGSATTLLPWLGDIIPLPGPAWLRSVASAGDLLLFAGVVALVAMMGKSRRQDAALRQ